MSTDDVKELLNALWNIGEQLERIAVALEPPELIEAPPVE